MTHSASFLATYALIYRMCSVVTVALPRRTGSSGTESQTHSAEMRVGHPWLGQSYGMTSIAAYMEAILRTNVGTGDMSFGMQRGWD